MAGAPDYRSDKSASLEGQGIAYARWRTFHHDLPEDIWEDIYFARVEVGLITPGGGVDLEDPEQNPVPPEVLAAASAELTRGAVEESELYGFYVAWHLAGGFAKLQEAGWHRATIHRKIRRFRARFGQHPDELFFPWLRLDVEKAWKQRIVEALHPQPPTEPDW